MLVLPIVLGNSMVLFALLSSKARKSRMNFFITHLAAAGQHIFVSCSTSGSKYCTWELSVKNLMTSLHLALHFILFETLIGIELRMIDIYN
jgi:hypothetical protein